MTAKEIREKETSHLTHELEEQKKHLFDLRSQAVTEKLEDPSQLRKTRKDIARIKTILRQREIDERKKSAAEPATDN
jgi:large subunit ribosomal protein L29